MKSREILVFLIAIVSVLALVANVVASDDLNITPNEVYFDGIQINSGSNVVSVEAGQTVPVRIYFTANEDAEEVQVSAWLQGERSNAVEQDFADLIVDSDYNARLSLAVPSDLDEIDEDLTLYVRIESDSGNWEEAFTIRLQRAPYKADVLFIDVDSNVKAGSSVPVDIVISNMGRHELDNVIVAARISSLGIQKQAFFGDLSPTDDEDDFGEDATDAVERRMFLSIPANVQPGIYALEVEAYNSDTSASITKNIAISNSETESRILTSVTGKDIARGGSATYDLIVVNSGSNIGVYEIVPGTATNLVVSVDQPILTVAAGSSKVVKVNVQAGDNTGTYPFTIDVTSDGQLVNKVSLSANVVSKTAVVGSSNVVILTVVLAVVFIVLLIVLIVLLSRKPEKTEEFGESYY